MVIENSVSSDFDLRSSIGLTFSIAPAGCGFVIYIILSKPLQYQAILMFHTSAFMKICYSAILVFNLCGLYAFNLHKAQNNMAGFFVNVIKVIK